MSSKILQKAVDAFGDQQKIVACEELAELIQAISKYERYPTVKTRENVLEEIVDVGIMLGQLELLFEYTDAEVKYMLKKKISKLERVLNESE